MSDQKTIVKPREIKTLVKRLVEQKDAHVSRREAWQALVDKLTTEGRMDLGNKYDRKAVRCVFQTVMPTPPELFTTIKIKRNDAAADRQQILQGLEMGLDLIDNEADYWMWRLWPVDEPPVQPKARPNTKRQPSATNRFADEVYTRKQTWLEVKTLNLLENPLGFFISIWGFCKEELSSWKQTFYTEQNGGKQKTRRGLWTFLVGKLVIDPDDRKEIGIFRKVFFRISPTPDALINRINHLQQTLDWNRFQARQELIQEFQQQTIPGEIDYHLDKLWPESKKTAAIDTAAA